MEFRRFKDEDYDAVCDFLIALNDSSRDHINWNWARFEWMYEHPDFDKSLLSSIGLWTDQGRIVGAAVYDMYLGEAFSGALPGYGSLYPEILAYAYRFLKDDNGLAAAICGGCTAEIHAAETQGFVPTGQTETVLRLALDQPLSTNVPEGYRLRELDPATEGTRGLQWLFWQGFDHGDDKAEFEKDYERTMRAGLRARKHFDPRLSIAAADPGGENAAYCCVWYLPGTDYAYVEPVCTVPAHRGRGLGRAVVSEALNRARSLGAREALVISDLEFYAKSGFRKYRDFTFYRKNSQPITGG